MRSDDRHLDEGAGRDFYDGEIEVTADGRIDGTEPLTQEKPCE